MERAPGSTYATLNCGVKLHTVDRATVLASLRPDLDTFLDPGWFVVVMFDDGTGIMRGQAEDTPPPPEEVLARMLDLAVVLNRDAAMRGHWIVSYANHMVGVLWRDRDGDLQFTWEVEEPWPRLRSWSTLEFAGRATIAWDRWNEHMKRHRFSPGQQHKRALGEAAPMVRQP